MIFVIVVNRIVQKNIAIVTEEVKLVDQSVIAQIVTTVRDIQMGTKIQILNQRRKQNFRNDLFIFFDLITVKIS